MVLRYVPSGEASVTAWQRSRSVVPFVLTESSDNKARDRFVPQTAGSTRALRVLQVMPPGKHFGPLRATSIDLDTHDLVRFSRYSDTTVVMADPISFPYPNVSMACYENDASVEDSVVRTARHIEADVIVVQQRLPLASRIAQAVPDIPVMLRLHSVQKGFEERSIVARHIRRAYRQRLYNRFACIVHPSKACQSEFEGKWHQLSAPSEAIGNGLDFSQWCPACERVREVLLVARCVPEKGVLEAVQAMAKVLPQFWGWAGHVILSSTNDKPAYASQVVDILNKNKNLISVELDRPFADVKSANERAAIALVPSKCTEGFGRTALEAHAGGAALISSGRGGLFEVSGDTALMLPEVSSEAIEAAMRRLLTDDARRTQLARDGTARARGLFDIRQQAARFDGLLERVVSESV